MSSPESPMTVDLISSALGQGMFQVVYLELPVDQATLSLCVPSWNISGTLGSVFTSVRYS